MTKRALITGVTGQDGSYLAELLLSKGYEVHGVIRRSSLFNTARIEHLHRPPYEEEKGLRLHYGDMSDSSALNHILREIRPDEIYNLAAQSHVRVSFDVPEYTGEVCALGVTRMLDAVRDVNLNARFYQASSSEMFGNAPAPQSEITPFHPRSPYACAKVYAYHITQNYREAYGHFAVNGILFNHESPRRAENFVTRKITRSVGRIAHGLQEKVSLGNLDAQRDWGYAPEYIEAMWRMLQQDSPDDFVVATGETHSVREFCEKAFKAGGIEVEWSGSRDGEQGRDRASGKVVVDVDPKYYRPVDVDLLQGDPSKAGECLGWTPKVRLDELVDIMTEADMDLAAQEAWALKRK